MCSDNTMGKELTNVDEINTQLGRCLRAYEKMTETLEANPERVESYKELLEASNGEAYGSFIIPIYNALSHGNLEVDKISFSRLLQHISFHESLIKKQTGGFSDSNGKTILGEPRNDTTFHDFLDYGAWGSVGKIMEDLN